MACGRKIESLRNCNRWLLIEKSTYDEIYLAGTVSDSARASPFTDNDHKKQANFDVQAYMLSNVVSRRQDWRSSAVTVARLQDSPAGKRLAHCDCQASRTLRAVEQLLSARNHNEVSEEQ